MDAWGWEKTHTMLCSWCVGKLVRSVLDELTAVEWMPQTCYRTEKSNQEVTLSCLDLQRRCRKEEDETSRKKVFATKMKVKKEEGRRWELRFKIKWGRGKTCELLYYIHGAAFGEKEVTNDLITINLKDRFFVVVLVTERSERGLSDSLSEEVHMVHYRMPLLPHHCIAQSR